MGASWSRSRQIRTLGRVRSDEDLPVRTAFVWLAIMDTGYQGYLGQEFVPRGPDPIAALRAGVEICDV